MSAQTWTPAKPKATLGIEERVTSKSGTVFIARVVLVNGIEIGHVVNRYGAWEGIRPNGKMTWSFRTRKEAIAALMEGRA